MQQVNSSNVRNFVLPSDVVQSLILGLKNPTWPEVPVGTLSKVINKKSGLWGRIGTVQLTMEENAQQIIFRIKLSSRPTDMYI